MVRSLRFQFFWAPVTALVVGGIALGIEVRERARMTARLEAVTAMRLRLEPAIFRLAERHARTTRRTRGALLEPELDNQVRILSRTSEQYLRELVRLVADAATTVANVTVHGAVPDADPHLEQDMARLQHQLDNLLSYGHAIAPTLDALLEAITALDPEALLEAERDFDRADSDMHVALRVTTRMAQVATKRQARHATTPIAPVPLPVWVVALLFPPLSLWLAYRPLARIAAVASGRDATPKSREESMLAERIRGSAAKCERLEASLTERTREAERQVQSSRRAERELALLRLYNENLVNSLRSAIVVTDASGIITSFNRAARTLLGLNAETVGTPVDEHPLFSAVDSRSADAAAEVNRALSERQVLRFDGLPFPAAGGETIVDLTVAPYLDESGAARGLLWVADDVTDAIRIKKQLLAAERLAAVGSLSAQVAHEIRNPLSAIGLNAELLEEELSASVPEGRRDEVANLLHGIGSEIERLTQVTEGYLRLARMPEPDFRDVDLNQVVGDLFTMLNSELKAHAITVSLDLASPPPLVWGDPGQLRQALLNIVRNSREAMPDGGKLRVTTHADDVRSVLELSDTGIGIPSELVSRVFEPFYTTKPQGTGLGLSLTHQIIAEHGGGIEVLQRKGGGHFSTTIRITLPYETGSGDRAYRQARRIT